MGTTVGEARHMGIVEDSLRDIAAALTTLARITEDRERRREILARPHVVRRYHDAQQRRATFEGFLSNPALKHPGHVAETWHTEIAEATAEIVALRQAYPWLNEIVEGQGGGANGPA